MENQQRKFIIWWAGLLRGAVTIALCYYLFEEERISSRMCSGDHLHHNRRIIQYCGVWFHNKALDSGGAAEALKPAISEFTENAEDLRFLLLENAGTSEQGNNQGDRRRSRLSLPISHPTSTVHYFWRKFDDKYMGPIFGGRGFVP